MGMTPNLNDVHQRVRDLLKFTSEWGNQRPELQHPPLACCSEGTCFVLGSDRFQETWGAGPIHSSIPNTQGPWHPSNWRCQSAPFLPAKAILKRYQGTLGTGAPSLAANKRKTPKSPSGAGLLKWMRRETWDSQGFEGTPTPAPFEDG